MAMGKSTKCHPLIRRLRRPPLDPTSRATVAEAAGDLVEYCRHQKASEPRRRENTTTPIVMSRVTANSTYAAAEP